MGILKIPKDCKSNGKESETLVPGEDLVHLFDISNLELSSVCLSAYLSSGTYV